MTFVIVLALVWLTAEVVARQIRHADNAGPTRDEREAHARLMAEIERNATGGRS